MASVIEVDTRKLGTKDKIVRAATDLLTHGGREAVSTRAVAAAAGVRAPTIYRHFEDMKALLEAVASYGFASYFREKTLREPSADPVEALRQGWDLHVAFGLANPGLYTLIYGDPRPDAVPAAASQAFDMLRRLMERVAREGRLQTSVERAAQMLYAAACGVTLTLLKLEPEARDLSLSAQSREAVLAALTLSLTADTTADTAAVTSARSLSRYAVALKAALPEVEQLTSGERALLSEWLDRLS